MSEKDMNMYIFLKFKIYENKGGVGGGVIEVSVAHNFQYDMEI